MRILAPAIGLFALALVQPALATEPKENDDQKTEKVEKAEEPKKICRRISTGMGSRRQERVCMTSEEWREFNNQR